ncbi:MAG: fumarylacetoacetate hydrolase family protein [Archaeoglobaceae archaeon]
MKFVTFRANGDRIGFVVGGKVVDLRLAYASYLKEIEKESTPLKQAYATIPSNMIDFLDREDQSMKIAKNVYDFVCEKIDSGKTLESPNGDKVIYDLNDVKLRAPIPIPRLMVDFSTFEEHVKMSFEKMGQSVPAEWYVMPVGYKMNPYSVIGPEEPIVYPSYTQLLDYELEFAVVIGKKGKNIPKEKAYDFVFGYTIVNDVSARDVEYIELRAMPLGPLKSKDFDSATPMGPWIVTKDEINDPHNLKMQARVNGEVWSEASTKDMYWKIPDLIEHLSREQTIYPGMILLSGTPGHGCGLHIGRFLNPGDVVELEIEKIGVLRNRVVKIA